MNPGTRISIAVATIVLLILAAACSRSKTQPAADNTSAKKFTAGDVAKLHWIEGTWKGTGDVEKPFYERYKFEGNTLVVESFADEKIDKVTDVTRFELKDGAFGNGGDGSRWTAVSIDDQGITFDPVAKARNSFRWERVSDNLWKATMLNPARDNKPASQLVYQMQRLKP